MTKAELSRLLIDFYDLLSQWEHDVVRGSRLTPQQMHALETLGHEGSLRMKEMSRHLGVTTGTLTALVDRLERKKLVERVQNEKDRRSYLIQLTDEGRELFEEHDRLHARLADDIADIIGPERSEAFGETLKLIISEMGK